MRRSIDEFPEKFLELRLRRYLTFAEFKSEVAPHLGLGISHYATWTSPIRKYGDMVNHRLIKQVLLGKQAKAVDESILVRLQEARRQNRLVERDIADWLYARYLFPMVEQAVEFDCEIADVSRGGVRAKVIANGAQIFVPFSTIHDKKKKWNSVRKKSHFTLKAKKLTKSDRQLSQAYRSTFRNTFNCGEYYLIGKRSNFENFLQNFLQI
ncbi:exoribonuclease II [Actinobacillus equuli]|nr:exoribonuclease II [Actinobacillus equuli]